MAEQFEGRNVAWLKEDLTKRGGQVSDQGCAKHKTELVELAQKAFEMKLPKTLMTKTRRKLSNRNWNPTKDVFHDLSLSRTGPVIFLARLNSLLPTSICI